ncbi:MAG: hypothetical protein JXR73_06095 [Candidatus Omnitrophica bacterium]|nr:hypothetical protein [Candidatus Omnitrophota bacterium]
MLKFLESYENDKEIFMRWMTRDSSAHLEICNRLGRKVDIVYRGVKYGNTVMAVYGNFGVKVHPMPRKVLLSLGFSSTALIDLGSGISKLRI